MKNLSLVAGFVLISSCKFLSSIPPQSVVLSDFDAGRDLVSDYLDYLDCTVTPFPPVCDAIPAFEIEALQKNALVVMDLITPDSSSDKFASAVVVENKMVPIVDQYAEWVSEDSSLSILERQIKLQNAVLVKEYLFVAVSNG